MSRVMSRSGEWTDQLTTRHHGEADHLAWLERPFAEALRALDERGRR